MFMKTALFQFLSISGSLALPTSTLSKSSSANLSPRKPEWGYGGYSPSVSGNGMSWYSAKYAHGAPNQFSGYQCYDGTVGNFPSRDKWLSFDQLFEINRPTMALNDSPDQIANIKKAIMRVSRESNVDAAFTLAVVMQESTGKVNIPCSGHNCGLMQGPDGSVCYDPSLGYASIERMIRDGIFGTSISQTGYVFYLQDAPSMSYYQIGNPGNPYEAARCYNSGRVVDPSNLNCIDGAGTKAYVNDIANRLVGWDGGYEGCAAAIRCGLRNEGECW